MAGTYAGMNQFGNYGQLPGQTAPRQQGLANLDKPPPTGVPGTSVPRASTLPPLNAPPTPSISDPTAQKQGIYNGMNSTPSPTVSDPAPRQQGLADTTGAAGQKPPGQQSPAAPAQPPPTYQSYQQPPAPPQGQMTLGDYNAPGAWTNGFNPHMEYPSGTFPGSQPQAGASPAAPPTAGQPPPGASPDPYDGTGWANGVSPQSFMRDNPGYATTGYYGTADQVAAQVAGGAQSAGKPMGVLGPDSYTQNPATGPVWTPPVDPMVAEAQRRAAQQQMDDVGRFAAPVPTQYPPGTFQPLQSMQGRLA